MFKLTATLKLTATQNFKLTATLKLTATQNFKLTATLKTHNIFPLKLCLYFISVIEIWDVKMMLMMGTFL